MLLSDTKVEKEEGCIYFWAVLEGLGGFDLNPEIIEIFNEPTWSEDFLESWKSHLFSKYDKCFNSFGITYQEFGIREGIAPNQKFLVKVYNPIYYRSSDGDWDSKYTIEIVDKEPISEFDLLGRWEEHLASQSQYIKDYFEVQELMIKKQWCCLNALTIEKHHYFLNDTDDIPVGLRLVLRTRHSGYGLSSFLVSGESDEGDYKLAFDRLCVKAHLKNSKITKNLLKKLLK
jgi:hypothetical protein